MSHSSVEQCSQVQCFVMFGFLVDLMRLTFSEKMVAMYPLLDKVNVIPQIAYTYAVQKRHM
jgi:hypothetical protein